MLAMFFMGPFELLILLALVVGGAFAFLSIFRGFSPPSLGKVQLACPHCGRDTLAHLPVCQHCQTPLR